MGVHLSYSATELLPQAASASIMADATAAVRNANQPWLWCEPPILVLMSDGRLEGASKLNPIPHPDDRADAAQYSDAENDLTYLLGLLCRLSRDHAVSWELSVMGEPLGTIVDGVGDPGLEEAIGALASLGEAFEDLDPDGLGLDALR